MSDQREKSIFKVKFEMEIDLTKSEILELVKDITNTAVDTQVKTAERKILRRIEEGDSRTVKSIMDQFIPIIVEKVLERGIKKEVGYDPEE